ncbi:MAG TPA: Gfo/Idh/MocA family oxidoreductase [Thermomicrobiales bacterium]|nr:Gfo/Idh/MocA family oxidoreductase [Thermomicrobiales bacterium]
MVKVGIIGCGDVATHSYMPALNEYSDRVKVVALFDIIEQQVEKAKSFHPDAAGYTDYEAFLNHDGERMDMVLNLTPAPLHRDITSRALEAGYSVYSEKPIASSMEDAEALVKLADEKGLHFFCAPATMVTGRMLWLKQLADEGTFGRPYLINAQIGNMGPAAWREYSGDPRVFYTPKVGPLINLGVYMLTTVTGFFGPAKRIQAMGGIMFEERVMLQPSRFGQTLQVEVPDLYSINIEFEDNRYAHLLNSFALPRSKSPMFELFGSMGMASVNMVEWYKANGTTDLYLRDESESGEKEGWQEDVEVPNPTRSSGILDSGLIHALDVLEKGVENKLTAAHAMHVLEIMLACGTAIESGESIEIKSSF